MTLDDRVVAQLGGCTLTIHGNRKLVTACLLALNTCKAHDGAHHFAVIGEGLVLVCSQTAVECLRDQGVQL